MLKKTATTAALVAAATAIIASPAHAGNYDYNKLYSACQANATVGATPDNRSYFYGSVKPGCTIQGTIRAGYYGANGKLLSLIASSAQGTSVGIATSRPVLWKFEFSIPVTRVTIRFPGYGLVAERDLSNYWI